MARIEAATGSSEPSGSVPAEGGPPAVLLYCALAFGITWVGVLPLVAAGLGWYRGSVPPIWHAVGALGPVGAALLVTRIVDGRSGFRRWLAGAARWRIGRGWWIVAAGGPVLLLGVASLVAQAMAGGWGDGPAVVDAASRPTWWLELGVASVVYGLGEEAGWRGFLLPRLMRRSGALVATLVVAVVWAAWHAPFFAYRFDFSGPSTVVGFFVAMAAGALWLTFLYLSTEGSVPAVAAWHAVWNVANLIAAEMSDLVVGVLNGAMIVLGFGVLLVVGPRLRWGRLGEAPVA